MKYLFIVLLLVGCGVKHDYTYPLVDLSKVSVSFNGNILESQYSGIFEDTEKCLHDNFFYAYKSKAPQLVVIMDTQFDCGGTIETLGGCVDRRYNTIYVNYVSRSGYPLNHEVVHWMTNMDNEGHGTLPFLVCAP